MKTIRYKFFGRFFATSSTLAVELVKKQEESADLSPLFLRFALTLRGTESLFFPAFLLDDWGTEIGGLTLYQWLHEQGERFPRATVFGYEQGGAEGQLFVRELELGYKLPCFLYPTSHTPLVEGRVVDEVISAETTISKTGQIKPSAELPFALRHARVQWKQPPQTL